jgi:hypothetical protein
MDHISSCAVDYELSALAVMFRKNFMHNISDGLSRRSFVLG